MTRQVVLIVMTPRGNHAGVRITQVLTDNPEAPLLEKRDQALLQDVFDVKGVFGAILVKEGGECPASGLVRTERCQLEIRIV